MKLILGFTGGLFLIACSPATDMKVATSPTVMTAMTCVVTTSSDDYDKKMSAADILIDVEKKCGLDEVTAIATLNKAEKASYATKAARTSQAQ